MSGEKAGSGRGEWDCGIGRSSEFGIACFSKCGEPGSAGNGSSSSQLIGAQASTCIAIRRTMRFGFEKLRISFPQLIDLLILREYAI